MEINFKDWLSNCESYIDIDDWYKKNFVYDHSRFTYDREKKIVRSDSPQTPEETYNRKSGACHDVCRFSNYCLKKKGYQTDIVTLIVKKFIAIHFLNIFYLPWGMYIIEYGSWAYNMHGIWGPFYDVEEIINGWYIKYHPRHNSVEKYFYGWPSKEDFIE